MLCRDLNRYTVAAVACILLACGTAETPGQDVGSDSGIVDQGENDSDVADATIPDDQTEPADTTAGDTGDDVTFDSTADAAPNAIDDTISDTAVELDIFTPHCGIALEACRRLVWNDETAGCDLVTAPDGTPCADGVCRNGDCVAACWAGECPAGLAVTDGCHCRALPTGSNICTAGIETVACDSIARGQLYWGQDAHHDGRARNFVEQDEDTVLDLDTGLVWAEEPSAPLTILAAEAFCANPGLPGTGWRMPTIHELFTLVDTGATPCLWNDEFEDECQGDTMFWSSSQAYASANYCTVHPRANVEACERTEHYPVRCVRAPAPAGVTDEGRYEVLPEVVLDLVTGVAWQAWPWATGLSWPEALAACAAMGSGWRLPTTTELFSVVDVSKPTDGCARWNSSLGNICEGEIYFWSSTANPISPDAPFAAHLSSGHIHDTWFIRTIDARCVHTFDVADKSFGFHIRTPEAHDMGLYGEILDVDYVCTFTYGAHDGHFYVMNTPETCGAVAGCQCTTHGAWLSIDGEVFDVPATYSWGGNHENDWVRFEFDGYTFRYFHSSFGYGWRACQEPDCLQVYRDEELVLDGCEPERSIPVTCRRVRADGTFLPLTDNFEPCPGDPSES